jgi:hypothetical protein
MIDQASVFADRFKNNRQALQAAVLGQNSGVDPYTALRALQLLKESDSMQMAQQGQQPTESPSLLQEAMQQPQGLAGMPIGQPVPGQQMPQQMGQPMPEDSGIGQLPAGDMEFAGGGILAFAAGAPIPGPTSTLASRNPQAMRLMAPLQEAVDLARKQYEGASASGDKQAQQMYLQALTAAQSRLDQVAKEQFAGSASAAVGVAQDVSRNNETVRTASDARAEFGRTDPRVNTPGSIPTVSPITKTGTSDTSSMGANMASGIQQVAPGNATDDPVDRGIGAIAQSQAMTDALATQSAARAKLGETAYNPPAAVEPQTATQRFEGAKDQIANVKEYMGEDKYSDEARKIIEERTADLTNPDRNKFDKALAWFKGAAAMQKGRGLESIANAAGEVAGAYSVIKKEDRKEKNAIRDMNLNLTKAEQAREDGQKSIAMDWQDKAQADKVAAAEAKVKIYDARVKIETAVKSAIFESADKDVLSVRTNDTQKYIAEQSIKSQEKTRKQTAEGQQDNRNNNAYLVTLEYYRKTVADVDKSKAKDVPLQNIISNIARYERMAADGRLDQKGRAKLEAFKEKQNIMESKYTSRIQKAEDDLDVMSKRVMGKANVSTGGNDQEAAARQWLKNNPNDPRAAAIRTKLGM